MAASRKGYPLAGLAMLVALLPFITIHVSYLWAASQGHVDWCLPYWDSCTSISATGRELPEKIWFKLGMMPAAVMAMGFWCCAALWRRQAGPSQLPRTLAILPWVGGLAALFLLLYTAALGEEGQAYRLLRRSGITLSFTLTYLSQLLLTRLILELEAGGGLPGAGHWPRRLFRLNLLLLAVGLFSLGLEIGAKAWHREVEDALEWWMALLINLYFLFIAALWQRQGAHLQIGMEQSGTTFNDAGERPPQVRSH